MERDREWDTKRNTERDTEKDREWDTERDATRDIVIQTDTKRQIHTPTQRETNPKKTQKEKKRLTETRRHAK